jgi:UDP-N-acetylmuramyl pentapeptide phosphotransferase/UDP-N-acetylglucosamine-1-phosphate transferase
VIVTATGRGYPIADWGLRRVDATPAPGCGGGIVLAMLLYGALGAVDDRFGDRSVQGLRGHLRSLVRDRRVTTGLVKAVGGAAFGLALAAWVDAPRPGGETAARAGTVLLGGVLIALSANAVNLLDLRPLRAIKGFGVYLGIVLALAALLAPARLPGLVWLALPVGALAAYVPIEARCRAMLGDTGANALGAAAGVAAVWGLPWTAQLVLVIALGGLHLFAERRSITAALAVHPWLDRLDRWGWEAKEKG